MFCESVRLHIHSILGSDDQFPFLVDFGENVDFDLRCSVDCCTRVPEEPFVVCATAKQVRRQLCKDATRLELVDQINRVIEGQFLARTQVDDACTLSQVACSFIGKAPQLLGGECAARMQFEASGAGDPFAVLKFQQQSPSIGAEALRRLVMVEQWSEILRKSEGFRS